MSPKTKQSLKNLLGAVDRMGANLQKTAQVINQVASIGHNETRG